MSDSPGVRVACALPALPASRLRAGIGAGTAPESQDIWQLQARCTQAKPRGLAVMAWIGLALLWFATAQVRPLLDPDEGRYAEIPREMLVSGDWITPRLDALKYFEKPPLQYWATAQAYRLFGVSEWTSRLWALGLAFACLPLAYAWTRRLYGEAAGRAALLALATSPYFAIVGHINLLDSGFTFWLTAAVFTFVLGQAAQPGSTQERYWMLAAWLTAALAVLSKGVVVGVLGGATLVAYSLLERDWSVWKRLRWAVGIPVFLAVAAPWFIVVSLRNPDFLHFFFVHEHFARFLTTVHQRVEPWWYFIPILFLATFPWLLPLARAWRAAWVGESQLAHFKPLKFLLVFAAVTFVFFSASHSKLAAYVLPLVPVLAAVLGASSAKDSRLAASTARNGAAAAAMIALGLQIYSWRRNGVIPIEVLTWSIAGVAAMVVGIVVVRVLKKPLATETAVAVAASAILGWQFLLTAYSMTPPARSGRDLVAEVRSQVHPDTALYSVGQFRETLSPYLKRTLTVVDYEGELHFGIEADGGRGAATYDEFVERWASSTNAIAFVDPSRWQRFQDDKLPGHTIASDGETIVVSRQ